MWGETAVRGAKAPPSPQKNTRITTILILLAVPLETLVSPEDLLDAVVSVVCGVG